MWFSGTGVIIGEHLIDGHSWTMGVVLLVTVGVGTAQLCVLYSIRTCQLGNVPEVARQPRGITLTSTRTKIINHSKREDVESLKVFWRSTGAADDVEQAEFAWQVGSVIAAHCHHE